MRSVVLVLMTVAAIASISEAASRHAELEPGLIVLSIEGRGLVAWGMYPGFWRVRYNNIRWTAWLEQGHEELPPDQGLELVWDDQDEPVLFWVWPAEPCTALVMLDPPRLEGWEESAPVGGALEGFHAWVASEAYGELRKRGLGPLRAGTLVLLGLDGLGVELAETEWGGATGAGVARELKSLGMPRKGESACPTDTGLQRKEGGRCVPGTGVPR